MASLGYPQPWRPLTGGPKGGRRDQGRRLAQEALTRVTQAGRLVATGNLADVIEVVFGADVAVVELGPGFDGLATSSGHVKLVVLATSHVPTRQRFTLAHELAHLLTDDDQDVHLDRDVYDKSQAKDPSEMRANTFAAAFLMPEDMLRRAAGTTGFTETRSPHSPAT